jgi:hypothetical protein
MNAATVCVLTAAAAESEHRVTSHQPTFSPNAILKLKIDQSTVHYPALLSNYHANACCEFKFSLQISFEFGFGRRRHGFVLAKIESFRDVKGQYSSCLFVTFEYHWAIAKNHGSHSAAIFVDYYLLASAALRLALRDPSQ